MKPLSFAFIACNKNPQLFRTDPSYIYRCENLALALKAQGHQIEMLHYTQIKDFGHYDVAIFHRPVHGLLFRWYLNKLRRKGCLLVADVDDLIFAPEYAHVSPGVVNKLVSLRQTEKNFQTNAKALACFDKFTTSTLPLQQKLWQYFPASQVLLLPNTVHSNWYTINQLATQNKHKILTYFPGTRSHDRDFASIAEPLAEFLHENQDVQLHITGVLNCTLNCRAEQLQLNAKVSFTQYPQAVANSWVNLAPLEYNEFNLHKSAIKAIEAAFFGAPTLATPIPDMQRLADCGALLVNNATDWFSQLTMLCQTSYYQQHSFQLREKILAKADIQQQTQSFIKFTGL